MQFQVQNVEGCEVKLDVVVENAYVKQAYEKAYKSIASKARVDGFRKGKAPRQIITKLYGPNIDEQTQIDLVNEFMPKVMDEIEGQFSLTGADPRPYADANAVFSTDNDFKFHLSVEIFPSLEKKNLKDIHVDLVKVNVVDSDVDKVLEMLRERQAKWEVVDDLAIDHGTLANINFLGKKDGEPFQGGAANGFDLDVDNSRMIPGFTEALMGHKAGEEFTINVTFPADYTAKELAGVAATFDIKVNSVSKKVLPELNDDFFAVFNMKGKTLDEVKASLRRTIESQSQEGQNNINREYISATLVGQYPDVAIPLSVLVNTAYNRVLSQLGKSGFDKLPDEVKNKMIHNFASIVKDEVTEQVVMRQVLVNEGLLDSIVPSAEEVELTLKNMAANYDASEEEFLKEAHADKDLMRTANTISTNNKVLNLLADRLDVNYLEISYDDMTSRASEIQQKKQERILSIINSMRSADGDDAK